MQQIQLSESQVEFPPTASTGRIRSRIHHSSAISHLKLMMMANLVFASFWTVITCIILIYPTSVSIQLPPFINIIFLGSIYVCFFLVLLSLKFGYLKLLSAVHVSTKVVACMFLLLVIIMHQYAEFRKEICLCVILFLYLYQSFLGRIIQQWPAIEESRWRQYMDPISKFAQQSI